MKKWKKLGFSVLLASTTLLSTACAGAANSDADSGGGKTTIEFMHWGGDETFEGVYQERIENFEKENPDIKVKTITVADDYDTKLQTMIAGKQAPDVAQVAENGSGFASKNAFIDLTDKIKEANIDIAATWGSAIDLYTLDNKIFGIPDRGGSSLLYYNKVLFDEAGIEYPNENWTIDDYYKAAETLTKDTNGDGEIDQWGSTAGDYQLIWGNFLRANGGAVIEDGKVVIDSAENQATIKAYDEAFKKWSVSYQIAEDKVNRFQAGLVGMNMTGFWDMNSNAKVIGDKFDYGIAPMPIGTEKTSWSTGSALTISTQSSEKEQEASWKFIEYMASEEAQQLVGKGLYDCPANLKTLNSDEFLNQKVEGHEIDLSAIPVAQERVVIDELLTGPWYSEATTEARAKIKEMLLGNLTPEETLSTLQKNLTDIVAKY